jgi:hypothetical protein
MKPRTKTMPVSVKLFEAHQDMIREIGMMKIYDTQIFREFARYAAEDATDEYFAELERYRNKYGERCKGGEEHDNRRAKR